MQKADCTVRLSGDLNMTVRKHGVTPAEIIILRHLHGNDAVVEVDRRGMDKRPHKAEKDRLVSVYGQAAEALFPGKFPRLPVTLEEVEVADVEPGDAAHEAEEAEEILVDDGEGDAERAEIRAGLDHFEKVEAPRAVAESLFAPQSLAAAAEPAKQHHKR